MDWWEMERRPFGEGKSRYKYTTYVDGLDVYCTEDIPYEEKQEYVKRALRYFKSLKFIKALYIDIDGDKAGIYYIMNNAKFERIRRITGYLVGTLDRFNDGKRAEEHDRVKHNV